VREQAKRLLRVNLGWLRRQADWKEAFGDHVHLLLEAVE
jgi:hypothetical protein